LERFQNAVAKDCRQLHACREIANASKHMRRKRHDPKIRALVEWFPVIEPAGHAHVGDSVMSLSIYDDDKKQDATRFFIQAIAYWENLLMRESLLSKDAVLPQKIIKATV
jgi:hypothetical protein